MSAPVYKRILLKLSGEALIGNREYGIDPEVLTTIARQIKEVKDLGVEMALVIGGGNIFRGMKEASNYDMDRSTADYMGMLATVINAMALQFEIEKTGIRTRIQSALEIRAVSEPFIKRRAIRHLEKGRVVIFAAGTGNPYFTTDTAAALRSMEIDADIVFKATKVDAIYSDDPFKNPSAKKIDTLNYEEYLAKKLKVLDRTAVTLCMENDLPILVFDLLKEGNIKKAILGEKIGSIIRN